MCIRIIPRWSLTSSLHSLALRTEPICCQKKCREHQSVRGVRWRKWKTHKDGRQRTTQSFHRKRNGRKDCRAEFDSQPAHSAELQSAEIRSLTLKSSAEGIHPEFECRAQNRVHVETALIFITPAALCATGERHLRRIMCVKQCDCNNCYKKKTCIDCQYSFENKDVDCNSQGIQGCKYKIDKIDYPKSEDKRYCCICKWYAEFEGVCCCGDSEFRADFRCLDDTCPEWMSKESES